MLGNRGLSRIMRAIVSRQHYVALWNMPRVYTEFVPNLHRYLTRTGSYPTTVGLRTPAGIIEPTLYSPDDLITVNEIFCRLDYPAGPGDRVVIDIGSNIGISALWFLTRGAESRCYLFEPNPLNIPRLHANLGGFEPRCTVSYDAVAERSGTVEFGVEPTGRYGGIGVQTGEAIRVNCRRIGDVLEDVLSRESRVDVLKIDTEGLEVATVQAIDPAQLKRIRSIYIEAEPAEPVRPGLLRQRQYGAVCHLHPVS